MASLIEMPELVMENIIWFSDFRAVLTLRQVCRDFRNFIDDLNDSKLPDSKLKGINLCVGNKRDMFSSFEEQTGPSFRRKIYSEMENSRSFNGKTTDLGSSNIVDVAIRDLELVLKFQKTTFEWFSFHTENAEFPSDSLIHTLPVKMNNMVKKLNRKIKTKSLSVATVTPFGIMSILPFIDSESLDSLRLYPRYRNMEIEMREIVKTEQWKKAKEFHYHCESYPSRMKSRIEEVTRFSKVIMQGLSVTPRDLLFLKEVMIIYSSTIDCPFAFSGRLEKEKKEFSTWPPAFVSESSNHWYFGIGNTWEFFLEITTGKSSEKTEIDFKIIRSEDVPDEAIIQG